MEKEKSSTTVLKNPINNLQSPDIITIERLVNTSDHTRILDLLKHIKGHSTANVLKGFRPLKQNWPTIARRLTSQALSDPYILQSILVQGWLGENQDLFGRVVKEIDDSNVEEALFRLLVEMEHGDDTLTRLWCCLLLDGRESTQQAFNNGLGDALLDENSSLRMRARLARQINMLEQNQQQIRSLQGEVDSWKQRYEQEVVGRQQEQANYKAGHTQQTETIADLGNTTKDLQAKLAQAEQQLTTLSMSWDQEQAKKTLLEDEVTQIRHELVDTRQKFEEIRGENTLLQGSEEKLQAQLSKLEKERDGANDMCNEKERFIQELKEEVGKWQRLKQSVMNQYQGKVKQQEDEITGYRRLLAEKSSRVLAPLSPTQLDIAWRQSLTTLSQHFSFLLTQPQGEHQIITTGDKLTDWQHWQHEEEELVRALFSSPQLVHATHLIQVEKAQRLLLVRWYLLEWLRSTISQTVRVANDHESQD